MEKNSIQRGKSQQISKAKPQGKEALEKQVSPLEQSVLAMLDAASSAMLGQLAGGELLRAAGSLGNQSLLAGMKAGTDETIGLRETAAIMDGAEIPAFEESLNAQSIPLQEALPPASVPQFAFFGNQPASFEAILDLAVGSNGTALP